MPTMTVSTLTARILVVDDEAALLKTFRYCLEAAGYRVVTARNPDEARQRVQGEVFDLCFLDLRLGSESALDLLPDLRIAAPWMRIVVVTAYSSIDTAVRAMREGAVDYLVKPCSAEQLRLVAARQLERRRMELRLEELERKSGAQDEISPVTSSAPAVQHLLEMARAAADTDASVLLLGESGTGKGVLARMIHCWSRRAKEAFVVIHAPSLNGELFESELFGHVRGAFTGAVQNAPGRVSQADGGSLFLDEVGDVPLALQPKLLRFLQEKEYERVGDAHTRVADVRLIAATNRDLSTMVRDGHFREDLLYRLDVIRLLLPPLRERHEDILPMAERFLAGFVATHGRRARGFGESARHALLAYAWPGNVRELHNVIERASILCNEDEIQARHLGLVDPCTASVAATPPSLEHIEREHICSVLTVSTTLEEAARVLGIDVSTLYRKRKQYGI